MAPSPPWGITFWSNLRTTAAVFGTVPPGCVRVGAASDGRAMRRAVELVGAVEHTSAGRDPGVTDAGMEGVNDREVVIGAVRGGHAGHRLALTQPDDRYQRIMIGDLGAAAGEAGH